jgi:hypothetical protein
MAPVKTGRLLKFHRPGGEVQAYLYEEAGGYRASVYLMSAGSGRAPLHVLSASDPESLEASLREWVEARFPKDPSLPRRGEG